MHEVVESLYGMLKEHPKTTLSKGATIFREFENEMMVEETDGTFTVTVPSQSSNGEYEVELSTNEDFDTCTCPAQEEYGYCKHVPAAIFSVLIDYLGIERTEIEIKLK